MNTRCFAKHFSSIMKDLEKNSPKNIQKYGFFIIIGNSEQPDETLEKLNGTDSVFVYQFSKEFYICYPVESELSKNHDYDSHKIISYITKNMSLFVENCVCFETELNVLCYLIWKVNTMFKTHLQTHYSDDINPYKVSSYTTKEIDEEIKKSKIDMDETEKYGTIHSKYFEHNGPLNFVNINDYIQKIFQK